MPGLSKIRDYEGKELNLAQPLREQIVQEVKRLIAEEPAPASLGTSVTATAEPGKPSDDREPKPSEQTEEPGVDRSAELV